MRKHDLVNTLNKLGVEILHSRDDGWLTCRCPFAGLSDANGVSYHKSAKDHRPSFFARADTKRKSGFNCYSCGQSGNITSLITALGALRRKNYTALAIRANLRELDAGISYDYDMESEEDESPQVLNEAAFGDLYEPAWENTRCRKYLKKRIISERTARMLGLLYDADECRVLFPVRDRQHRLYGFSGRTLLEPDKWPNEWYGKVKDYAGLKKKHLLLGSQFVDLSRPIMLNEGLFAVGAAFEEGVDSLMHPVGTMMAALTKYQADILVDWGKPIYMFFDNDKAGKKGILGKLQTDGTRSGGAAQRLSSELPVFIPKWPKGFTDPDELAFRQVRKMMRKAMQFVARTGVD